MTVPERAITVGMNALYYPYTRAMSSITLKKAALLFDSIAFIDSEAWPVRNVLTKSVNPQTPAEMAALEDDYNFLLREGMVEVIDSKPILLEFGDLIASNVIYDIRDDDYCILAAKGEVSVSYVLKERIPEALIRQSYVGRGTFSESVSAQAIINAGTALEYVRGEGLRRTSRRRWGKRRNRAVVSSATDKLLGGWYRYAIGMPEHDVALPTYRLSFLHASSLRINEGLVAAAATGRVPFTDSSVHDSLLRHKIDHTLRDVTSFPNIQRGLSVGVPSQLPQQHIALEILRRSIPDEGLAGLTMQEVMQYRSRNRATLERLHHHLEVLAFEIEGISPGYDYEKNIRRLVATKIAPGIEEVRRGLAATYRASLSSLATASGAAVLPTVSATVYGGLGLWQVLIAAAIAEGGVLGSKGLEEAAKIWQSRHASRDSPLAYFAGLNPDQ